ncbi:MAG: hypothetical protein JST09_21750 [Bacteroidetes bacterium]|jgi:hypothetical protein|nr:hypothetical protein [Bacteroidota bacterium]WHZ06309.1 MAG: hypothetical protein OJF59_000061 [Cytophagales bacterium]WHZ06317.1 MAG: hypothetical protein OJF59_000069 [Cytophagales bacterium]
MWKKIKELWSQDYNPGLTKIITLTIMPVSIIGGLYWGIQFNQTANLTFDKANFRQGTLNQVQKQEFGDKGKYNYRLRLENSNEDYYLISVMVDKSENLDKLFNGATVDLYFIEARGKNEIVSLTVDSIKVLDIDSVKRHYGGLRTITFVFVTLFSIWFGSRVYRYTKKGRL